MNLIKYFIIIIIAILISPAPASAKKASVVCKSISRGKTDITVKAKTKKTKYNYKKSIMELTSIPSDTVSPYAASAITQVHGLTRSEINSSFTLAIKTKEYAPNRICIWPLEINVTLILDPLIYIAKEHKVGSCRRTAVKGHELKHVRISKNALNDYKNIIRKQINSYNMEHRVYGPISRKEAKNYQKRIEKE